MSLVKRTAIALVVCILFVVLSLLLLWRARPSESYSNSSEVERCILERARPSEVYSNSSEVERCILENDHQKLHLLLQNETNRKCVYSHDVSIAMERGHLEVVQEISGHKDILSTITRSGVKESIRNGHVHIVKYILGSPSLKNIIFEDRNLLRAVSDNDKLMKECVTGEVVLCLLGGKDDVLKNIMSNEELKKHISAWMVDYLTQSQDIEGARHWNHLAWLLIDSGKMIKLVEKCQIEKFVSIMECNGMIETHGSKVLQYMLSSERYRELLKDVFIENKHRKLMNAFVQCMKSMRGTYIKLVTFLLGNEEEEHPDNSAQLSYEEMCDLSTDTIRNEREKTIIERLSNTPGLSSRDVISVYKKILFRRKICAGWEELKSLPQSTLEKLRECFDKEEIEIDVELVARRLEKKDERVALSIHEFCMVYGETKGRHLKSDGMIRSCLSENYCAMCRKALIGEKPHDEEDSEIPKCPVCENDYSTDAKCSKVEYEVLACGHVYHSSCLKDYMKSCSFDNECPHESCQKPIVPNLSEHDITEIRNNNGVQHYVQQCIKEIRNRANKAAADIMNDSQVSEAIRRIISSKRGNYYEIKRFIHLLVLEEILQANRKDLVDRGIYEKVKRGVGFDEREFHRLDLKYHIWFR